MFRLGLAFDGGGDVMIAIGPLVFLEFAQALIETFDLFPPVNVFNLNTHTKKRNKRLINLLFFYSCEEEEK